MDRATPGWCKCLMELSLWCAITVGVFFSEILGPRTTLLVSAAFIGLMTATWLLHWVYLRWFPFAFSWTSVAGIALGAYFVCFHGDQLGDRTLAVLICLPLFLVIPGAFTDRQVARFLVFLCFTGGIQVLLCFVTPTLFEKKASLSAVLQEGRALTGSLSNEAELTAALICAACAAAMFAAWALTRLMPARSPTSPGGRANLLASPGVNLAVLGGLLIVLVTLVLFLAPSLVALPTFLLAAIILVVVLGGRKRLSGTAVIVALAALLLVGTVNLSRPAPGSGGSSGATLQANLSNLIAGDPQRTDGSEVESQATGGNEAGWDSLLSKGDWGILAGTFGSTALILVAAFLALLVAEGIFCFVRYKGPEPVLIAGAIAGVVGIGLTCLWGNCLANPGLALLGAAFCAMAAAGGEYDEEYEEVELLTKDSDHGLEE